MCATERPFVRSDELADGDVEGAGDSAEGFEFGAGGVAENAADEGGSDFRASGQVIQSSGSVRGCSSRPSAAPAKRSPHRRTNA